MKIQLSKTKTIDWTPPWEKSTSVISDVVGIELCSGNPAGCPAVRLQRRKDVLGVTAVGFISEPKGGLPSNWDDLSHQPRWSVPSSFRADCAALAINSAEAFTRQTATDPLLSDKAETSEGIATSKDGVRSVHKRMADQTSVLQASLPEYQALWLSRLLPEGRRPTAVSVQTTPCTLLCSLSAQPGFCADGDELAVFVTQASISIAGFRQGLPLLYRTCPGAAGAAAMRAAVKTSLGLDDTTIESVFGNNGVIDTRRELKHLLSSVAPQVELSLDYLKSRLGSDPKRIILMGDAAGCAALRQVVGDQLTKPIVMPNPFDGLALPTKFATWKEKYCTGDLSQVFLSALGAALAVMGDAK